MFILLLSGLEEDCFLSFINFVVFSKINGGNAGNVAII